jgi:hypothetical protein
MMPPFMDGELYRRTPYRLTTFDKLLIKINLKIGKWSLFGWKTIIQCKLSQSHMAIIQYPNTSNDGFFCKIYCSRCGEYLSTMKYVCDGWVKFFNDKTSKEDGIK